MDIGKIGTSVLDSYTSNASRAVDQTTDDSFAEKLENAVKNNDEEGLKAACQQFESIMLNMMYKSMKATIIKSDLIEKDAGTEIFESMQDEALMDEVSKSGSFGLAESLYKQLSRQSRTGVKNDGKEELQETEPVVEKDGE